MKLMLIGGGNNGHGNSNYETKEIDEEIVKMTQKNKPIFLFIGLASNFSDSYYDIMKNIYKNLGCECLYLKKKNIINNPNIVKEKIAKADIIYIGGGDSYKLVNTIKEYQIDKLLKEAITRNCIIAGISAGAILISNFGLSDYQILSKISNHYDFVQGLKILNINICPHSNNQERIDQLKELIKNEPKKVIALEDGCALKLDDNKYSIIKSKKDSKIKLMYWENALWNEKLLNNKNINKILKNIIDTK